MAKVDGCRATSDSRHPFARSIYPNRLHIYSSRTNHINPLVDTSQMYSSFMPTFSAT